MSKVLDFLTRKVRTREARYGRCKTCGYEWVAPTIGKCPRCGRAETERLGRRHFDYVRS